MCPTVGEWVPFYGLSGGVPPGHGDEVDDGKPPMTADLGFPPMRGGLPFYG